MSKTLFPGNAGYSYFQKLSRLSGIGLTIFASFLFLLRASAQSDRSLEARQLEPQQYIALINKGQQAYYSEMSSFTDKIEELGLSIRTETENYSYRIKTLEEERVVVVAIPKNRDLKSYTGAVFLLEVDGGELISQGIICESDRPSQVPPSTARTADRLICGLGSSPPISNASIPQRQLEAKRLVGTMNRAQQAYYAENGALTDRIDELGIESYITSNNYTLKIKIFDEKMVVSTATSKTNDLKSYTGVVFLVEREAGILYSSSIICESDRPSRIPPFTLRLEDKVICAFASSPL